MNTQDHILIVDDDREIRTLLGDYLQKHGFRTSAVADGKGLWSVLDSARVDLVILDVMLPGDDGFVLCRNLRARGNWPVIMLTAKGEDTERIVGLELGADDYMPKPFNPRELLARVRAVLRRTGGGAAAPEILRAGDLVLDLGGHQATLDGRPFDLTPTEFDLLAVLMQNPGRVFTRLELLERVQGYAYEGYERTIDAHVKNLRAKLGEDPRHPRYVQTVFGVGYKLGAEL
jgi:DNA-binding response OmpR family regulator